MQRASAFLLAAFGLLCSSSLSDAASPLFTLIAGSNSRVAGGKAPKGALASKFASVRLNSDALKGSSLEIGLPWSGQTFTAVASLGVGPNARIASQPFAEAGSSQWIGSIPSEPYSIVALAQGPDSVLSGSVLLKGQTFSIQHQGSGVYSLYEVDHDALPVDHPLPLLAPEHIVPRSNAAAAAANPTARVAKAAEDAAGEVDVAVFYTTNARAANGEAALQAKIRAAIAASNAVYAASKLTMRLRLAYMGLATGYKADAPGHDMAQTLQAFTNPADGNMDIVHEVRARYGADAMVLISGDASFCGLAYIMTDPSSFQWPFSVMSAACLPLTFTHELGHNFGMQHDHAQAVAGTPFKPSSFGYRVPGNFSTIMSYPCASYTNCPGCAPCPRIPYFSNPEIIPTGASQRIGKAGMADATATINDPAVLHMAANWGLRRNPGAPSTPTHVKATWTKSNRVSVSWAVDTKNAVDFYRIWRKVGTGSYRPLRNVYGGSATYGIDHGATPGTTRYCYKVQSVNFIKSSALSVEVCAPTTQAARLRG